MKRTPVNKRPDDLPPPAPDDGAMSGPGVICMTSTTAKKAR